MITKEIEEFESCLKSWLKAGWNEAQLHVAEVDIAGEMAEIWLEDVSGQEEIEIHVNLSGPKAQVRAQFDRELDSHFEGANTDAAADSYTRRAESGFADA